MDYSTGQVIYPDPMPENYFFINLLYLGNLAFMIFIASMMFKLVMNLKSGESQIL